jgi:hypothetical protein
MASRLARASSLLVVTAGLLLAACGGQLFGETSSGGGGGSCVTVDTSTYDQSCQTAADCIAVTSGQICNGDCACGGSTISASEQSRYDQAVSSIQTGTCFCPDEPVPQCIHDECTLQGTSGPDSGPAPEAGVCVDVDLSSFDQSCQLDSDCMDITAGKICTGQCACGGSAINVSSESAYEQAIAPVGNGTACPCPFSGQPRCLSNHCALCGVGLDQPAGCPDGGP